VIVELYPFGHRFDKRFFGLKRFIHDLDLHDVEKRLHGRVVETSGLTGHTLKDMMFLERILPVTMLILKPLICMDGRPITQCGYAI